MKKILFWGAALLVLAGCSKNESEMSIPQPGERVLVGFRSLIDVKPEPKAVTKADIGTGVKVTVRAFDQNGATTEADKGMSEYTAAAGGVLENGSIYLPSATYDFYGVSTNSTASAPAFTAGVSAQLSNGVDYIWAKAAAQAISAEASTVSLTFDHKATRIVFTVKAGNGITLNSLDEVTLTPSAPSASTTMALATGVITPATAIGTAVTLPTPTQTTVEEKTVGEASYVMLPLAFSGDLTVAFKAKVNSETAARTYETTLKAPENKFEAGKAYAYTVTLNANTVSFSGVLVNDWTAATGGNLTPTEK